MDRFSLRINGMCDQSVFRRHGGSLIVCVRASKPSVYLRLDIGASNVWLVLPLTRASGLRELRRLVFQLQLGGKGSKTPSHACSMNLTSFVLLSRRTRMTSNKIRGAMKRVHLPCRLKPDSDARMLALVLFASATCHHDLLLAKAGACSVFHGLTLVDTASVY